MTRDARSVDRFAWLRLVSIVLFVVLLVRLGFLQIVRGDHFSRLAEAQRLRTNALLPSRGALFVTERENERPILVATTRLTPSVYAVPRDIRDAQRAAEILADVVLRSEDRGRERRLDVLVETGQMTHKEAEAEREAATKRTSLEEELDERDRRRQDLKNDFVRRLGNPVDPYEPILSGGEQLDADAIAELQNAGLDGIAFREIPVRSYPEGTFAAHVLGFVRDVASGARGEYGLEAGLDPLLRGEAGITSGERDVAGRLISVGDAALIPPQHGADVVLTIDRILQTLAEDIARKGKEVYEAESTQVLMLDPNTGAVLAMASYPTFDPNAPSGIRELDVYKNAPVSNLFEPGSVFKPIVMGAALNGGLVNPDATMDDTGPIRVGPYTIDTYDGQHHGTITMTEILEHSNNVGMVWVARRVGAEPLYQFIRRIGIGDRTGLPVPGEASSLPVPPGEWGEARLATVGFGQGIVATPIQILVASAALINGGRLLEPTLIREVRHPGGRVEEVKPKVIRQIVHPETSTKLRAMLVSVVENGVAIRARVPGHYVGGKTGTAQVTDPDTGRYSPDKKIISFIGFAPAENPAFIAMVKLDNPAGLSFASGTAAPLFGELAAKTLEYLRIPPSRPIATDPLRRP